MLYLTNAFSLNMLTSLQGNLAWGVVHVEDAKDILSRPFISAVGHADTAALFTTILGTNVPMNRVSLQLQEGDELVVGQYSGPRLNEGSTSLPEGATIKWFYLAVEGVVESDEEFPF